MLKYYIKYQGVAITLVYCNYNFNYYIIKRYGVIIAYINKNYKNKKLLHKIIKSYKEYNRNKSYLNHRTY